MEAIADEVHKPIKKQKEFRKVKVYYVNDIWSADIVEMNSAGMEAQNDGFKYVLCVVDCYTRFAFCVPLKNKTANTIVNAFEYIIDETIKCWDGTFCCKISKISSNDNNSLIPIPDLYQLRIGYDGEGYYLISMMAVTNNATGQGKAGFSNYNLIWPKIDLSR